MNLKNKNILFIGPVTYEYHNAILYELKNMGANVDFFGENTLALAYRITKKLNKKIFNLYINNFKNKIHKKINETQYDYIFLIRGDFLSKSFLNTVKNKQQSAKFIMYQWDSIKVFDYLDLASVFDKICSFDPEDCEQYGFTYLPLFYDNDYKKLRAQQRTPEIDLLFVGSLHSDRVEILEKLDSQAEKYGLKTKFLLYMPFFTFIKNVLFNKDFKYNLDYMIFSPINKKALLDLFASSEVIVDINNINQSGLTIRTIETLGSGKKLLTTNKSILNDTFYNKDDIEIFDRKNPILNLNFLKQTGPSNSYKELSIDSFFKTIFEE